ncbi:hypothetical protein CAOG_03565 [Capsaspora owczarzaki ATCC 30864]|uniref:Uncharacterized protein n=1 Tax=Capsaspora owczarzaki (strain ATCC 30864) TaxID=595528 RepID=A0A0D2WNH1_CAPO3|nr:hypothetical protein CAOG_03565 [Capsaspora owczarzaki ATCC 30864]KJE92645.1 hypothetical protein CAOG_003565 [Capsaspora owczarzaki ATCC 30864]|eukprot:XP_004363293.1 hypothetical protein CAOG_03565 [Capsaspora owczarzaki ATCC 30864]
MPDWLPSEARLNATANQLYFVIHAGLGHQSDMAGLQQSDCCTVCRWATAPSSSSSTLKPAATPTTSRTEARETEPRERAPPLCCPRPFRRADRLKPLAADTSSTGNSASRRFAHHRDGIQRPSWTAARIHKKQFPPKRFQSDFEHPSRGTSTSRSAALAQCQRRDDGVTAMDEQESTSDVEVTHVVGPALCSLMQKLHWLAQTSDKVHSVTMSNGWAHFMDVHAAAAFIPTLQTRINEAADQYRNCLIHDSALSKHIENSNHESDDDDDDDADEPDSDDTVLYQEGDYDGEVYAQEDDLDSNNHENDQLVHNCAGLREDTVTETQSCPPPVKPLHEQVTTYSPLPIAPALPVKPETFADGAEFGPSPLLSRIQERQSTISRGSPVIRNLNASLPDSMPVATQGIIPGSIPASEVGHHRNEVALPLTLTTPSVSAILSPVKELAGSLIHEASLSSATPPQPPQRTAGTLVDIDRALHLRVGLSLVGHPPAPTSTSAAGGVSLSLNTPSRFFSRVASMLEQTPAGCTNVWRRTGSMQPNTGPVANDLNMFLGSFSFSELEDPDWSLPQSLSFQNLPSLQPDSAAQPRPPSADGAATGTFAAPDTGL